VKLLPALQFKNYYMKAAVLESYNHFSWKEVPDPEFKPDEVLVRIQFASICGTDMHIFPGDFHPRTPVPFIPGHEMGGLVAEVGSEVSDFARGDKVAVDPIIWCGRMPRLPEKALSGLHRFKTAGCRHGWWFC
jgi:D-arabinose 1-dehydrogenase-like Zn-dependent alcohol dehydrogenase